MTIAVYEPPERQDPAPKARPGRRAGWAVALSLGLHAVLLLAFVVQHTGAGGQAGGGYDRGQGGPAAGEGQAAITLALVSASASTLQAAAAAKAESAAAAQAAPPDPLQALMSKAQGQAAPQSETKPPPKAASLDALIAEADQARTPPGGAHPGGAPAAQTGTTGTGPKGGAAAGGGAPGRAGELFAQVEPCWRRALGASTVPVTLEVAIDRTGRVAGAPKIASGQTGSGDAHRIAVERALQAVAACLPFHAAQGANPSGVYRVEFGMSGG